MGPPLLCFRIQESRGDLGHEMGPGRGGDWPLLVTVLRPSQHRQLLGQRPQCESGASVRDSGSRAEKLVTEQEGRRPGVWS